jgi:hypothetical protein
VIVVTDGFQIEKEGLESLDTESGCAEQGAFEALGGTVAEDATGAAAGGACGLLVIGQVVEKALDSLGSGEAVEEGQLTGMESVGGHQIAYCTGNCTNKLSNKLKHVPH